MRSFMLLITLIMISFSLSILPLDVKSFEINFDHVFNPIDAPGNVVALPSSFTLKSVSSAAILHFNPQAILIDAEALDNPPDAWEPLLNASLVVIDSFTKAEVKSLNEADLARLVIIKPTSDRLKASINLNVAALNLKNGSYSVQLKFNNPQVLKHFEYTFHIFKSIPYSNVQNAQIQTAMKLYYPDATRTFLIPVFKPIATTDRMIRSSLNSLMEVPKGLGLYETPLVPRISRADFTGGITKCNILKRDLLESTSDNDAALSFSSIAKTLFEVKSTYVINQVEFTIDGNQAGLYKGVDLSKPFVSTNTALAYLPYSSASKILLASIEVEANDGTATVESVFKALQTKPQSESVSALLPPEVLLLDQHIEGRNLILNFNDTFKSLYFKHTDLQKMLLDALSLSFCSIDGIDQISLKVNGVNFSGWENVEVLNPFTPPTLFNQVP